MSFLKSASPSRLDRKPLARSLDSKTTSETSNSGLFSIFVFTFSSCGNDRLNCTVLA